MRQRSVGVVCGVEQLGHPLGGLLALALDRMVGERLTEPTPLQRSLLPETAQDGHHGRVDDRRIGVESLEHLTRCHPLVYCPEDGHDLGLQFAHSTPLCGHRFIPPRYAPRFIEKGRTL